MERDILKGALLFRCARVLPTLEVAGHSDRRQDAGKDETDDNYEADSSMVVGDAGIQSFTDEPDT